MPGKMQGQAGGAFPVRYVHNSISSGVTAKTESVSVAVQISVLVGVENPGVECRITGSRSRMKRYRPMSTSAQTVRSQHKPRAATKGRDMGQWQTQ